MNSLATLSITFVGFSALLIFFRQTVGGPMSKYDNYFVLTFIQTGFIVAIGSIIPQAAQAYPVSPETAWRISSILIAIPLFLFVATLPRRRRIVTGMPMPFGIRIPWAFQWLAALLFVANAVGKPLRGLHRAVGHVDHVAVQRAQGGHPQGGALHRAHGDRRVHHHQIAH